MVLLADSTAIAIEAEEKPLLRAKTLTPKSNEAPSPGREGPGEGADDHGASVHDPYGYHDNHTGQIKFDQGTAEQVISRPVSDLRTVKERLLWVGDDSGLVKSRRAWCLAAGVPHSRVTMILDRLEGDPDNAIDYKVFLALAAVVTNDEGHRLSPGWLAFGIGSRWLNEEGAPRDVARAFFLSTARDHAKAAEFVSSFDASSDFAEMGTDAEDWLATYRSAYITWARAQKDAPPEAHHPFGLGGTVRGAKSTKKKKK